MIAGGSPNSNSQGSENETAFGPWDILPDIILPSERGKIVRLALHMLGRKLLLLFVPDLRLNACWEQVAAYAECSDTLGKEAHIYVVTPCTPEENAAALSGRELPFRVLSDVERRVAAGLSITHNLGEPVATNGEGAFTVLLADENKRVIRIDRDIYRPGHAQQIVNYLATFRKPIGRQLGHFAPVLYVPKVFEPELCQRLIRIHQEENVPTKVYRPSGGAGREGDYVVDPSQKVRRDHLLTHPELLNRVRLCLSRRLLPEIEKAFTRVVTGVEEFKVVCYEASDGGHFSAHRDNLAGRHAHRRFAMTLNLNTEEYEGGSLCFPEYGTDLYKPDTGDAVVFSCSLLHEAMPVTKGRRYVFLTFMFDEESRRCNPKYSRHTMG